jgi:mRNA (2'-O-methyladenosine-N6-)-methyltransferase
VLNDKGKAKKEVDELSALLSMQSAKEREERSQQEEILSLLSKPTAKELSLMDTFKSQDGGGVKEFCSYSTKGECMKVHRSREPCAKLHFVKILQPHTDESLGDCSFLNTCFHMDSCKYIHYEVDKVDIDRKMKKSSTSTTTPGNRAVGMLESTKLVPPQWIQCDMRNLKFEVLGKFSVIMADPPWDIHMELPYGTMSDDEMRQLPVPDLQVRAYSILILRNKICSIEAL